MSSITMLGTSITRQDRRLILKYARKFWNSNSLIFKNNVNISSYTCLNYPFLNVLNLSCQQTIESLPQALHILAFY